MSNSRSDNMQLSIRSHKQKRRPQSDRNDQNQAITVPTTLPRGLFYVNGELTYVPELDPIVKQNSKIVKPKSLFELGYTEESIKNQMKVQSTQKLRKPGRPVVGLPLSFFVDTQELESTNYHEEKRSSRKPK